MGSDAAMESEPIIVASASHLPLYRSGRAGRGRVGAGRRALPTRARSAYHRLVTTRDERPEEGATEEHLDARARARRKLLRLGVYVAPAVIGTLLASRDAHAAPPVSCQPSQCKPAPCHPHPCGPYPCHPAACNPGPGCNPAQCNPAQPNPP